MPAICVGNLTVGGAGKTPVALALAARLLAAGERPHLADPRLWRQRRGPLRVEPARHDARWSATRRCCSRRPRRPGSPATALAGAARRGRAGRQPRDPRRRFAEPAPGARSRLRRDRRRLWLRQRPGAAGRTVARAGRRRAGRAHAAIRLGCGGAAQGPPAAGGLPCLEAELRPTPDAPPLAGRRVLAFAGIGRPEKLFTTLREAGAELVASKAFPDHHRYRRGRSSRCWRRPARAARLCITTAKDAVRLPAGLREPGHGAAGRRALARSGRAGSSARRHIALTQHHYDMRCPQALLSKLFLTCALSRRAGT